MHRPVHHHRRVLAAGSLAVAALIAPTAANALVTDQPATPSTTGWSDSGGDRPWWAWWQRPASTERTFRHVGTFDVRTNGSQAAEIVDATSDGTTLIYTDSPGGAVGFIDISDPATPVPDGTLPVGGEPTSVAIGRRHALVGVNTSTGDDAYTRPTGELVVVELASRSIVARLPLGGQPDSVALSPNERRAAVVLENERNEDIDDGLIPQAPPGKLAVVELSGDPSWWAIRYVDFTSLPMSDNTDPEPEYVDINGRDQAVVTFQENNHIAVVDLRRGRVVSDFSAGSTVVEQIDDTEEELGPQGNGRISFTETIERRREPDTVAWIDHDTFAIANEGDYEDADGVEGGSRGFTLFNTDGTLEYESGATFEHASASAGHYNEGRSANKGGEPEAIEFGSFGGRDLLFVGSERANVLGVYETDRRDDPELVQLLPTGIGPEGVKAIEGRNLLAVANEETFDAAPSMVTLYSYERGAPVYPQLESVDDANGTPIPWVAMSGLAADPVDPHRLYAVSDSILAEASIYTIDSSTTPAQIVDRVLVSDAGGVRHDLDLEGIAAAPEGGFWVASEGRVNAGSERPNAILKVDEAGVVEEEVLLPADVIVGATSSGLEGVAVSGESTSEFVYVVQQRPWDGDADGVTKIGRYEVASGEWTWVGYRLDAVESPAGGWVGLSEITMLPDETFAIIERDNQPGTDARIKKVYGVDLAAAPFTAWDATVPLPVVDKALLADLLPQIEANSVWTPDKLEGLAVTTDGTTWAVTDNDGLDESTGQTVFIEVEPGVG